MEREDSSSYIEGMVSLNIYWGESEISNSFIFRANSSSQLSTCSGWLNDISGWSIWKVKICHVWMCVGYLLLVRGHGGPMAPPGAPYPKIWTKIFTFLFICILTVVLVFVKFKCDFWLSRGKLLFWLLYTKSWPSIVKFCT